jgi:hypothetical protein
LPFLESEAATSLLDKADTFLMFLLIWPLIAVAILAFGWIEDIAAKRGPRLWPNGVGGGRSRRRG